jgi:hypothetical protein
MKNKLILLVLLLTTPLIMLLSTLSYKYGYFVPSETKNNGTRFAEYFDATSLDLITNSGRLEFEDGKWIFATYASNESELETALYLMRQLNVALNRDIYEMKRVIFSPDKDSLKGRLKDYPRTEIIVDSEKKLYKKLLETGGENFFLDQKIFIIDSYGRAALFWPTSMDPKLILKDLKVLI